MVGCCVVVAIGRELDGWRGAFDNARSGGEMQDEWMGRSRGRGEGVVLLWGDIWGRGVGFRDRTFHVRVSVGVKWSSRGVRCPRPVEAGSSRAGSSVSGLVQPGRAQLPAGFLAIPHARVGSLPALDRDEGVSCHAQVARSVPGPVGDGLVGVRVGWRSGDRSGLDGQRDDAAVGWSSGVRRSSPLEVTGPDRSSSETSRVVAGAFGLRRDPCVIS